jgi:REP element-mobilizing transposase RayT
MADWHVFARGARRLELFRDREDYLNFISVLQYALAASGCVLWAFTLMTNHYHLVIHATSGELTECMRRLNGMYSAYHNRKYGLEGHAFDGPYRAYRHNSVLLLLRTIAYVFLNPVTAGLADRPEDYFWSSYKSFLGLPGALMPLDTSLLMSRIDSNPQVAWTRFYRAMERETIRLKQKPTRGLSMVDVHRQQFEWLLEHALENAAALGEDPRVVAMYWARQCGISPRAIVAVLGDVSSAQVGKQVLRLRSKVNQDPSLAKRLSLP